MKLSAVQKLVEVLAEVIQLSLAIKEEGPDEDHFAGIEAMYEAKATTGEGVCKFAAQAGLLISLMVVVKLTGRNANLRLVEAATAKLTASVHFS